MTSPTTFIRKLGPSFVIGMFIFLGISVALTFSQDLETPPMEDGDTGNKGLNFGVLSAGPDKLPPRLKYSARDGSELDYRFYESAVPSNKLLVLVHGSGWHGQQFGQMASTLSQLGAAHVITPDLRGHGYSPARRGDVDYIGQFEDDLADLITLVKKSYPSADVILGGHSSGGGLVVRFAGGDHASLANAYLLMAPYLKYSAPTTRENSGGWARPLTRRLIGLSMLNMAGITYFNDLPVIQFNMPKRIREGDLGHTATLAYSYRLNTSFAPREDYEADLAAMTQPFLLIAGSKDEAFFSDQYEPVISAQTSSGRYEIVPNQTHLGIVQYAGSATLIAEWLSGLK